MPNRKAAVYVKEAAGYPGEENSEEMQTQSCNEFCAAPVWRLSPGTTTRPGRETTSSE